MCLFSASGHERKKKHDLVRGMSAAAAAAAGALTISRDNQRQGFTKTPTFALADGKLFPSRRVGDKVRSRCNGRFCRLAAVDPGERTNERLPSIARARSSKRPGPRKHVQRAALSQRCILRTVKQREQELSKDGRERFRSKGLRYAVLRRTRYRLDCCSCWCGVHGGVKSRELCRSLHASNPRYERGLRCSECRRGWQVSRGRGRRHTSAYTYIRFCILWNARVFFFSSVRCCDVRTIL